MGSSNPNRDLWAGTGSGWWNQAACSSDGLPFDDTRGVGHELVAKAQQVCADCPVWRPCLQVGMGEPRGIWGGLTPRDRNKLKKGKRQGPGLVGRTEGE